MDELTIAALCGGRKATRMLKQRAVRISLDEISAGLRAMKGAPLAWLAAAKLDEIKWQSLDTAPRDGSKFLAFTADFEGGHRFHERVQEARWSGDAPDDHAGHFQSANGQIVLRWMPLPAPPNL